MREAEPTVAGSAVGLAVGPVVRIILHVVALEKSTACRTYRRYMLGR
jgi:hypothetical protein